MKIDITNADHAVVFKQLWDNCLNFGATHQPLAAILQAHLKPMSLEQARKLLEDAKMRSGPRGPYFDYVGGRAMKIEWGDVIDVRLYDINCFEGCARKALKDVPGVVFDVPDSEPLGLFPDES